MINMTLRIIFANYFCELLDDYEAWIPTPESNPFLYGIVSSLGLIGVGSVCLSYKGKGKRKK